MSYDKIATSKTPAHVIFLIDRSKSMELPCGRQTRMTVVQEALLQIMIQMVDASTKTGPDDEIIISPRFRIAILGYNDGEIVDIYGGFIAVDQDFNLGTPVLTPEGNTNTHRAFEAAERLIDETLPGLSPDSPAPLICHLTDGQYNEGGSPLTVAERIKTRETSDGAVLIENIFVDDGALRAPIRDIKTWTGVQSERDLANDFAKELFRMSSPMPPTYLKGLRSAGGFERLDPQSRLLFPGNLPELIKGAFAGTGTTLIRVVG